MARKPNLPPTIDYATLPPTVDPGAGRHQAADRASVTKGLPIRGKGGEQYLVLDQLDDSGAQADVYLVRKHNGTYALKLYHRGFEPSEDVVSLLERNECPNIAKLVEHGMHEGHYYFEVYSYYPGGTLASLMAKGKCTQSFIMRTLLPGLDEALHYLHENGLVHGDLKPANIFVAEDGNKVVLGDFGVASVLPKGSRTTTFRGTLEYAPPVDHQGNKVRVSPAYDYGALGLILLEAYTGHSPFAGKTLAERDEAWLGFDVARFTSIPPEGRNLIAGLLDKHERSRFGHEQVQTFLHGRSRQASKGYHGRDRVYRSNLGRDSGTKLELGFVNGRMYVARDLKDLLRFCERGWSSALPLLSESSNSKLGRFLHQETGSDDFFNRWVKRLCDEPDDERLFLLCAAMRERCEGQASHTIFYRQTAYRNIVHLLECVRGGTLTNADSLLSGVFLPEYLKLFGYGADAAGQVRDVVSAQSGAPAKAARILAFLTETPALVIGGRQVDSVDELLSILMHSSMSDIEAIVANQALDSWLYAHKCSNVLTELESFR